MSNMNATALHKLIERWRDLEKRRKDLDYDRAVWARDLRAAVGSDRAFLEWCSMEILLNEAAAKDLLVLANAAKVVPDATVWKRVGGSREIRAVTPLAKSDQVFVIEKAKSTGKAIRSIVREMTGTPAPSAPRTSPSTDAQALAHFVMDVVPQGRLTPAIRAVLARYVKLPAPVQLRKVA